MAAMAKVGPQRPPHGAKPVPPNNCTLFKSVQTRKDRGHEDPPQPGGTVQPAGPNARRAPGGVLRQSNMGKHLQKTQLVKRKKKKESLQT